MADDLARVGFRLLQAQEPESPHLRCLRERLAGHHRLGFESCHEEAGWVTCVLALEAACQGGYGVGAVVLDDQAALIASGHNELLSPYFRSDAHAEMIVISEAERRHPNRRMQGMTLYTSVEPCPMCYARMLSSGIATAYYLVNDDQAGMVRLADRMPPVWREMAVGRRFTPAPVSDALRQLAKDVFQANRQALDARLLQAP